MKFVVSSSTLQSVLQAAGRVISNKNAMPILDYFLLDVKDGKLTVTASDLETTQVMTIGVESVEKSGVIAAPVKMLLDLLKEFSEQPLTIEADESTWEIKVKWSSGDISIPGASGMSYPEPAVLSDEKKKVKFNASSLLNGINRTVFAAAEDELRPVMNGVFVNIESDSVTYVATDAHKLVRYKVIGEFGAQASFILPKKPVNQLKTLLARESGEIEMEFDDKNVVFYLNNNKLICRQIEGNYPNYNAVIPVSNPNIVVVDRLELLNAIKRVAVCSNQATNLIKLDVKRGSIGLMAQDVDYSASANETVKNDYDGDEVVVGFKSTFLIEILSNLETQTIKLELADSSRAGVFRPIYDEKQNDDTLMLLMPMMIND